jgi:hypothetical protein
VIAADARRIVRALGVEDDAKDVADAPSLSDDQRLVLRAILLAPNMTEPAPDTGAGPVVTVHSRLPGHESPV